MKKTSILALLTSIFLSLLPTTAPAEALFPKEITSSIWAIDGQCGDEGKRFFIFAGGFRNSGILCASTDSSQNGPSFYLFMECSMDGQTATYMGPAELSANRFSIDLTEYRGASGAPDIFLELKKCE